MKRGERKRQGEKCRTDKTVFLFISKVNRPVYNQEFLLRAVANAR